MAVCNVLLRYYLVYLYKTIFLTKDIIIKNALNTISKLSIEKIKEVSDFADFLLKKYEEKGLQKGMDKLITDSKTFDFLKEEEGLYSIKDLKERY